MTRLTHPRFGLDYAWGTISPSAHKAVGSSFACRYLSHDASKDISVGEARTLQAAGIDVVVVWETSANRALGGKAVGLQDAKDALAKATSVGMPKGRPIYFAVDFDTGGNPGKIDGYFDGVASVLGKPHCGPYGGYEVVKHLLDRGFSYAWQTYAWSGGRWDARAQLQQFSNDHTVGGLGCDYDHAVFSDFGQWSVSAAENFKVLLPDELAWVKEFDRLVPHKHFHLITLHRIRKQMAKRANEIRARAAKDGWGIRNRKVRYQILRDRLLNRRP